jgi:MOB kinase activator 1
LNEWLASNTVDFFNEISLLYGICAEDAPKYKEPGTGFPPGFEYRWQGKDKKLIKVSGPEYVDYVMSWIEDQLDNSAIFPELESQPFPADFLDYIKEIFKKMFRIFAIIYHAHFETVEKMEAAAHLNTCFKHFMYFVFEFKLVDDKEQLALKGPVARLAKEWSEEVA